MWQRQGMSAQVVALPGGKPHLEVKYQWQNQLIDFFYRRISIADVIIPTTSGDKATNILLKEGHKVMILKSPKGIYIQLESGKIISIKASGKSDGIKENSMPSEKSIVQAAQATESSKSEGNIESPGMRHSNYAMANHNNSSKNTPPFPAVPNKMTAQSSRMNTSSQNQIANSNYGNSMYHSERKNESKAYGNYQNVPYNKYPDPIHNAHALYPHTQSSSANADALKHGMNNNEKNTSNTHMNTMSDNRIPNHGMYNHHNAYNSNTEQYSRGNAKNDTNRNYETKPAPEAMSKYPSHYNQPQYANQMHLSRPHMNAPTTMPSHMSTNDKSTFIPSNSREPANYNSKAAYSAKEDNSKLLPASTPNRPYHQTGPFS